MIGIIGGSALQDIEGLKVDSMEKMKTPFGDPSGEFAIGKFSGKKVVFLPRHGKDHTILPSEINYRANIYAFKTLGVSRIISVAAVGSLKEEYRPLDVLLVDQFVDRTNQARPTTFFGEGIVGHVSLAEPVCHELRDVIYRSNKGIDARVHNGGTYINMEGPAFSTKAESYLYKSWGMDVIGMTNMPEARLSREAGICYATMAMITDYDCWYVGTGVEAVTVDMIIANIRKNMHMAKLMLANTIKNMPEKCSCSCAKALKDVVITRKDAIPEATLKKLKPILDGIL